MTLGSACFLQRHPRLWKTDILRIIEYQEAQALVFIEKTRLCHTSQFSCFYSRVCRIVQGIEGLETKVCSKRNASEPDQAESRHRLLCQLPSAAQYQYPMALTPTKWERSIFLHRSWLRLLNLGSAYANLLDELQGIGEAFVDPKLREHSKFHEPMPPRHDGSLCGDR